MECVLRNNHYDEDQKRRLDNALINKNAARTSAFAGHALLNRVMRCVGGDE